MYIDEIIYLSRDNAVSLAVMADGAAINHSYITRCILKVGATTLDSSLTPAYFDFTDSTKLTFKLGGAGLSVGRYQTRVIVYDSVHTNGVEVGSFVLIVKA